MGSLNLIHGNILVFKRMPIRRRNWRLVIMIDRLMIGCIKQSP